MKHKGKIITTRAKKEKQTAVAYEAMQEAIKSTEIKEFQKALEEKKGLVVSREEAEQKLEESRGELIPAIESEEEADDDEVKEGEEEENEDEDEDEDEGKNETVRYPNYDDDEEYDGPYAELEADSA
jgi:hypothetical protein